jgi:hypothetical protein
MVEPSAINSDRNACVYGSTDGTRWQRILRCRKDRWPIRLFQYGNAFLPDGKNNTSILAITTIAVEHADLETSIWQI